jgi:hypothetical protein
MAERAIKPIKEKYEQFSGKEVPLSTYYYLV